MFNRQNRHPSYQIKSGCVILSQCINTDIRQNLEFSQLVGITINKQNEMKHKLSACILIPTLASYTVQLKQGLKCMHSVSVSFQLLVSVLYIAILKIPNFCFCTFLVTHL